MWSPAGLVHHHREVCERRLRVRRVGEGGLGQVRETLDLSEVAVGKCTRRLGEIPHALVGWPLARTGLCKVSEIDVSQKVCKTFLEHQIMFYLLLETSQNVFQTMNIY